MNSLPPTDPATLASRFVNNTHRHVFLTGKAGTGKTTFLKRIVENTHKRCIIVAPTGIAAINAGGVTIHSMFQLPFGSFIPVNRSADLWNGQTKFNDLASLARHMQMNDQKRRLLRELELLIVDEVSMLRADMLDAMDMVLRYVRRNSRSFGGVQVLFIGDLLQLPPVVKDEEWNLLKEYYNSIYFFDARSLANDKPVYIELDKIYRQSDDVFITLLNNLRQNKVTAEDAALLNQYYKPGFRPSAADKYITLTTHNYKAAQLNKDSLQELSGKSFYYEAGITGDFQEYAYPVEKTLELKTGAQVMFVKNDPTGSQRFFNGKIGVVTSLSQEKIEVLCDDSSKPVVVERYDWENIKYGLNSVSNEVEETVAGTFSHYPLKLAWSITVHKSQGLTFDKAIIDIGDAFAPGQAYVALSRLRSLNGLVLTSQVRFQGITQDNKLTEFSNSKPQNESLQNMVESETQVFLKQYLMQSFDLGYTMDKLQEHVAGYNTTDDKKIVKRVYRDWAVGLFDTIQDVKVHADKFMNQVVQILDSKEASYLSRLDERVIAASNYFVPVFRKASASVFAHITEVKKEKRMKTYLTELLELESFLYEQMKRITKAGIFLQSLLQQKEFTKQEISALLGDTARAAAIEAIRSNPQRSATAEEPEAKKPKAKRDRKAKTKDVVAEKPSSREESLKLFQQGKSIREIALARDMNEGTIEGHLVYYITQGAIDAYKLVTEEKIKAVSAQIRALDTFRIGPLKEVLGNDYSYSEIRLAVAAYLAKK